MLTSLAATRARRYDWMTAYSHHIAKSTAAQTRKPISTGSDARMVRPVIAIMRAPTFWTMTPATYPQETRTPEATACHAQERAISDGATLTAYMASAAITPRNDTPMAPILPGAAVAFRRRTRPGPPGA